jgi:hypothetical protein
MTNRARLRTRKANRYQDNYESAVVVAFLWIGTFALVAVGLLVR